MTHGFELLREQYIEEFNTRAQWYRHGMTGAELLSLQNQDENKVFGITFRTPPTDSTGLPHIMEHSVLCGSRKYPLKEPFIELVKSSLNTFLNAFTYPDKTCYPCASQNLQDFYNLIDVYLDAVFHPLIPPHILDQEGWHYELETADRPMVYKGVVFNEMKGVYSSPDSLLDRMSQQMLFPDQTYGFDSGGDPRVIPELTYAQFKAFHANYYHPSNARIFFYGDDDPEERLRILAAVLSPFSKGQPDSDVAKQPRFDQPRRFVGPYATGSAAEGNGSMLTVSWLLPEVGDHELTLSLRILSHILVETPGSPLRKKLIDSGLGDDLTGRGFSSYTRQMVFNTGLKGVASEDVDRVEALILETLAELAENGIDPEMVEAAVNTVEFRLRENNTGAFPRGLALMLWSLETWLHDGDPIEPLAFEGPLQAVKGRLAAGEPYFEGLIQRYILNNPHRSTVILQPDPELEDREKVAEDSRLHAVQAALTEVELNALMENTRQLKTLQEAPDSKEALAAIPTLTLADLDPEIKKVPSEVVSDGPAKLLYHDLFTNGIVYLDLGFDLRSLSGDLLPYLPLFGRAILEMGTETEDYVRLSRRIGRDTGGIRVSHFTSMVQGGPEYQAWLFLRGKAMAQKGPELLAILRDVLLTARLDDPERFRQIVLEEKAGLEAGLIPAGHRVIASRLRSVYNPADWAAEQMGGVDYLFALRRIADQIDEDWPAVIRNLEQIRRVLLNRQAALANVTLDATHWARFKPELDGFLTALPEHNFHAHTWKSSEDVPGEGLSIPAQVNYVGKGGNLYTAGYQPHGSLLAIKKYLWTGWLWDKVRVQGGAYGGFCQFNRHSGLFTFLSYRDPNLLSTLETYDHTGAFLRELDLDDEQLTRSVIGAIGEMDAYQLPDAKGYTALLRHLLGDTDALRQAQRDELLATTVEDFRRFGETLDAVRTEGRVVVLGSQSDMEAANEAQPGLLTLRSVL